MKPDIMEDSLEDLYEDAPCGHLSMELFGDVIKVNRTFLDWTGYSSAQVLGQPFADLLTVGSRLFYDTRCLPVLRLDREIREVALVIRCADGNPLSILLNATVQTGGDGTQLVRTAIFDASRRQNYERDLLTARRLAEQSEVRVQTLQQASAAFSSTTTEKSVTAALSEIVREASDATLVTVMLLDETGGNVLSVSAGAHPFGDTVALNAALPEADAVRLGTPVIIASNDEAKRTYPEIAQPLHAARLEAVAAVPMLDQGESVGVLTSFFGRRREFTNDELELQRALAGQATQALKRIRLAEQLLHEAMHDRLTGLANRRMLHDRLEQLLAATARHGRPMALMFLDLDGFKGVNDGLGHAVGDAVLVQISERLRGAVRRSDTIARFGGDEFVVLCEEADMGVVSALAERIGRAIAEPFAGNPIALTASIGVAHHFPGGAATPVADTVLQAADSAMYQSKANGKNRYTLVSI